MGGTVFLVGDVGGIAVRLLDAVEGAEAGDDILDGEEDLVRVGGTQGGDGGDEGVVAAGDVVGGLGGWRENRAAERVDDEVIEIARELDGDGGLGRGAGVHGLAVCR